MKNPALLLGYDFLSQFITKIDFRAKKITFIMPENFSYKGNGKTVPSKIIDGHLSINGQPEGKQTGKWLLDTGSQLSIITYDAVRKYKLMGRARRGNKVRMIGLGGDMIMALVRLKKFKIEGINFSNALFMAAMKKGVGFTASKKYMGIIGMNILKHFKFYLDYKHQQIIFER